MFFHRKHKFGKVDADGYQYCSVCGKAEKPECKHRWKSSVDKKQTCLDCGMVRNIPCPHKWETLDQWEMQQYNTYSGTSVRTGFKYRKRCSICGENKLETLRF